MEFFVKILTAKHAEYALPRRSRTKAGKSFSEMRSGISRGSRAICLGAQGKSMEKHRNSGRTQKTLAADNKGDRILRIQNLWKPNFRNLQTEKARRSFAS
jgi:hypothetical protein